MTEQTARRIEKLLLRLLLVLEPKSDTPKVPSAVSVSSVYKRSGAVTDNGDDGDVPSQLEHDTVEAGPMRRSRRVVTIRGSER